jgi:aspartate aminotransferase
MVAGSRLNGIQLSGIRKMFELSTKNSVNLGLGEPDFQPAEHIQAALTEAVNKGYNKYGGNHGEHAGAEYYSTIPVRAW